MLYSMTAFARNEQQTEWGQFTWEIKTLNHRYLDVGFKIPDTFRSLEIALRDRLREKIKRGKVDCFLKFQASQQSEQQVSLNFALVNALINAGKELEDLLGGDSKLRANDLLRWPGCIDVTQVHSKELESELLKQFEQTIDSLITVRAKEGDSLVSFINEKLALLELELKKACDLTKEVVAENRAKLRKRFEELELSVDNNRMEQELALLVQRLDVTEELDRIKAHIAEVKRIITSNEAVGRRLDFIMQEFNREANTLASKSNSAQLTAVSVEMKVLIEQMREQVQNIE
jgi:uncharacterized protein (TIGR00255 family)